jgi:hypothetical protein
MIAFHKVVQKTGLVGESVLHGERIGWGGLPRHGAHPGE